MKNSVCITANRTLTERGNLADTKNRDRFVPRDDGGRMDRATSQTVTND